MTVVTPTEQQASAPPPTDDRPPFPRSNSSPWPKTASTESLSSVRKGKILTTTGPALKKRHSTYVLSSPPDPPKTPVPDFPPQRPQRNPARESAGSSNTPSKSKPRSRPSTATGTREEITPWEFLPGPDENSVTVSTSGSGSGGGSPLSARTRSSLITGPIAEVTPWELYPVQGTTARSSLTTGLVEEVTPWELYPVPTSQPIRSSLATGPAEEVTPWELHPAPKYESVSMNPKNSRSSPRVSTSSGHAKSLADLAHIRRRKSSGAKAIKARSNTLPVSSKQGSGSNIAQQQVDAAPTSENTNTSTSKSAPTTPKLAHNVPPSPLTVTLPSLSPSATPKQPHAPLQTNLKFSTADRTILEELKRNMRARAAQFVNKGTGGSTGSNEARGKKHHPYLREEVPYPRNYEREVLDLDVWETSFCQDTCESLTWHVFETPPTKVLDLGCGTGTWLLNCARSWKDCQFVGLDIVPLHPDLQQVGSPDLASRITWVQGNFLEGLPFPNEEFDFVHVKRIALGVPEDKWDFLLEEISRVMKPGGAFEMLEEDLFFPGKLIHDDSDSEYDSDTGHLSSRRSSHQDAILEPDDSVEESVTAVSPGPSERSGSDLAGTTTASTIAFSDIGSRSHSPTSQASPIDENETEEARDLLAQIYGDYPPALPNDKPEQPVPIPPSPKPVNRPLLHVKINTNGSQATHPQSRLAGSAVSLIMSSVASVVPPDTFISQVSASTSKARPRGHSSATSLPSPVSEHRKRLQDNLPPVPTGGDVTKSSPTPPTKFPPFLLRTIPKPPTNPRDHTLLETIYTQMLESRFINASPLALLANSLGLYFKDVRTHPPLQHAFPPVPIKPPSFSSFRERASFSESDSNSDSDDARDAILPSPLPRSATKTNSHRFSTRSFDSEEVPISDDNRYLNIRGLIHHSSPYITLDESRITAFSPSTKTAFPSGTPNTGKAQRGSRLPNTTMNLDLRSLNLHLALRAAEILACSESMWEWVTEYQAAHRARRAVVRNSRPGSVDLPQRVALSISSSRISSDLVRNSILELNREDFDGLLSKFDMDMRDKSSLRTALEDRFSWSVIATLPSPERKIFDKACEKWDKWEYEQHHPVSPHSYSSNRRKSHTAVNTVHSEQDVILTDNKSHNRDRTNYDNAKNRTTKQDMKARRASTSSGSTLLPPTHRLSRAMRVFVAWKA